MRSIALILVILTLSMAACSQDSEQNPASPSTVVCNKPYLLVGTSCCLDKNDNSICDADDVETPVLNESASAPIVTPPTTLSSAEMKLQATNFAQQLSRQWERNAWSEIYMNIPNDEKTVVSEKEFIFFMNITSPYARARYDTKFQESIYGGYYTGFKRGQGLKMTVGDVNYNHTSPTVASTTMSSMSFDDVPLNVMLFEDSDTVVEYSWRPFSFVWEDGRWKVETIGVYFMGSDPQTICDATNYPYVCIFEYAKTFKKMEYCDAAGFYVADCYRHFNKPVPLDKAVAGCNLQPEALMKDECLTKLMLDEKDVSICEDMSLSQDKFICYGIASGFNKNHMDCWDRITTSTLGTINVQKAQCIYGYVWVSQNFNDCDLIPEKAPYDSVSKCKQARPFT